MSLSGKPNNRLGRTRYATGYICGAAFIDRAPFYSLIEQCVLTASKGRLNHKRGTATAGMAPDFGKMAFEIRAALARVCGREIVILQWPELTPDEGTPGVPRLEPPPAPGEPDLVERAKAQAMVDS